MIVHTVAAAIARLVCWLRGHKRGKRDGEIDVGDGGPLHAVFRCPRCGATWTRLPRKKAA